MPNSQIITTTYYSEPKYDDRDAIINEFYKDTADRDVSYLMISLEGFVIDTNIFRKEEEKLKECLRNKQYKKYYKTINKMVKEAIKIL